MSMSADIVIAKYEAIYLADDFDCMKIGREVPLPKFSKLILTNLISETVQKMQQEPIMLRIEGDIVVVGDLHGNIADLLRILHFQTGSNRKFLFLGDYVDRGPFSIEVITLLLALSLKYPDEYFLIRGNHEFEDINGQYGFLQQIMDEYKDEGLWKKFNNAFEYFPIAAIVNDVTFCVHGGIAEGLHHVEDIENFKKPIHDFSDHVICDLMWSDPSNNPAYSNYIESNRGRGKIFGRIAVTKFLQHNPNIQRIVRGHQCVNEGVLPILGNAVITVFSASNYGNVQDNLSGILILKRDSIVCDKIAYPAIPQINKNYCQIQIIESTSPINLKQLPNGLQAPRCFSALKQTASFRSKNKAIGLAKPIIASPTQRKFNLNLVPKILPNLESSL